jgi:predicted nucleic acid-binding protein
MSTVVVLDTGPVGLLTNPRQTAVPMAIRQWLADLLAARRRVILPEISDYELRRELIRAKKSQSLPMLNTLANQVEYLAIDTRSMRLAAELWAQSRNAGLPTGVSGSLDGDVILAAQALLLGVPVVVATGNPAHLSRFVAADDWQNITP